MTEPTLILYDLDTKLGTLSPPAWKIRLELNYKKVNFKTELLAFTKIRPTYEKLGLPSTEHSIEKPYYSVPALIDTSTTPHTKIVDSVNIEKYIDEKYPEPPLYAVRPSGCSDAEWERKQALFAEVNEFLTFKKDPRYAVLAGFLVPKVGESCRDEDVSYFKESRTRWFQKPFEEIEYKADVVEARVEDVKAAFGTLEEIYERGRAKPYNADDPNDKPWLLGDVVSRADFGVLGQFLLTSKANPELWARIKTWNNGRWGRMLELSAEWRWNEITGDK